MPAFTLYLSLVFHPALCSRSPTAAVVVSSSAARRALALVRTSSPPFQRAVPQSRLRRCARYLALFRMYRHHSTLFDPFRPRCQRISIDGTPAVEARGRTRRTAARRRTASRVRRHRSGLPALRLRSTCICPSRSRLPRYPPRTSQGSDVFVPFLHECVRTAHPTAVLQHGSHVGCHKRTRWPSLPRRAFAQGVPITAATSAAAPLARHPSLAFRPVSNAALSACGYPQRSARACIVRPPSAASLSDPAPLQDLFFFSARWRRLPCSCPPLSENAPRLAHASRLRAHRALPALPVSKRVPRRP